MNKFLRDTTYKSSYYQIAQLLTKVVYIEIVKFPNNQKFYPGLLYLSYKLVPST